MQRVGVEVCFRRAVLVAIATIVTAVFAAPAEADVYYYKDKNGVFHFTNEPRPGATLFHMDASVERLAAKRPESRAARQRAVARSADYDAVIEKWATAYDVEPALIRAVIRAESGFNLRAVSRSGARGLMQLMPTTAKAHGVRNPYSAEDNIRGGVKHLRGLLDRYGGNVTMALAAYNAGEAHVDRHRGMPPIAETKSYVARVLKYRREYQRAERLNAAKDAPQISLR